MTLTTKKLLCEKVSILMNRDKYLLMHAINQAVKELYGNSANDQEKQQIAGELARSINRAENVDNLIENLTLRIEQEKEAKEQKEWEQEQKSHKIMKEEADKGYKNIYDIPDEANIDKPHNPMKF
jgi:hypothetical protein